MGEKLSVRVRERRDEIWNIKDRAANKLGKILTGSGVVTVASVLATIWAPENVEKFGYTAITMGVIFLLSSAMWLCIVLDRRRS